jgi:hypothetical protein
MMMMVGEGALEKRGLFLIEHTKIHECYRSGDDEGPSLLI